MLLEGTSEPAPKRTEVDTASMRLTAGSFDEKATALQDQLDKAASAFRTALPNLDIHDLDHEFMRYVFISRVEAVLRTAEGVRSAITETGDEISLAIEDFLLADSGLLAEGLALSLTIENWSGGDKSIVLDAIDQRQELYDRLGLSDVRIDHDRADQLVDRCAAKVAEAQGISETEARILIASQLANAGAVDDGDQWLGKQLAVGIYSDDADQASMELTIDLLDSSAERAAGFYNALRPENSVGLPERVAYLTTNRADDNGMTTDEAVAAFTDALADASQTNELQFTGRQFIEAHGDQAPRTWFDTPAQYGEKFLGQMVAGELVRREEYLDYGDTAEIALNKVADQGPEAAAAFYEAAGSDIGYLFRTEVAIPGEPGANHSVTRVFAALGQHPDYQYTVGRIIVNYAGASDEPITSYGAAVTQETIASNPEILANAPFEDDLAPEHRDFIQWPSPLRPVSVEVATNAVEQTYVAGLTDLTYLQAGMVTGMVHEARQPGPRTPSPAKQLRMTKAITILDVGRRNAGLTRAIQIDSSNDTKKKYFGYGVTSSFGEVASLVNPVVGIPADIAVSEATDHYLEKFFPTDHEIHYLHGEVNEEINNSVSDKLEIEADKQMWPELRDEALIEESTSEPINRHETAKIEASDHSVDWVDENFQRGRIDKQDEKIKNLVLDSANS